MPKKLQVLDQVHFKKKLQQLDQPILDPTLVLFLTSFEKNTTTGSSANFLSPEPNGQAYCSMASS